MQRGVSESLPLRLTPTLSKKDGSWEKIKKKNKAELMYQEY